MEDTDTHRKASAAGPLELACNSLTTYLLNFLLARHDHINFLYKQLLHNYNLQGEQSHFGLRTHQDHETLRGEGKTEPAMFEKFNCEESGACHSGGKGTSQQT